MQEQPLPAAISRQMIIKWEGSQRWEAEDILAREEPLEIRLAWGKGNARQQQALAVTMRTPGHDFELTMGFLYAEGVIHQARDVVQMRYVGEKLDSSAQANVLQVELHPDLVFDAGHSLRNFYASSSCGVCGKASLDLVQQQCLFLLPPSRPQISATILCSLPQLLQDDQSVFSCTGGIHAAGLFRPDGALEVVREDVGRHNALDKLVGWALRQGQIPLQRGIVLVSGRASFELVQKAVMAGIPILAAVGAPSSLAVELAQEHGMTLIGFLRDGSFNVYHDTGRVVG